MKIKFSETVPYDNGQYVYAKGETYEVDEQFGKRWLIRKKAVISTAKKALEDPRVKDQKEIASLRSKHAGAVNDLLSKQKVELDKLIEKITKKNQDAAAKLLKASDKKEEKPKEKPVEKPTEKPAEKPE